MKTITVSDVPLTREDLIDVRQTLIGCREASMDQWPEAIPFSLTMTSVISILSQVIEEYENV